MQHFCWISFEGSGGWFGRLGLVGAVPDDLLSAQLKFVNGDRRTCNFVVQGEDIAEFFFYCS